MAIQKTDEQRVRPYDAPIKELIEVLQQAQAELGDNAPVYLLLDNELHELRVDVFPKGRLGPGSVLLTKASQKEDTL